MSSVARLMFVALLGVCVAAASPGIAVGATTAAAQRIYKATKLSVIVQMSSPPNYVLVASGLTRTAGWTNPELKWLERENGVEIYEFIATPPRPDEVVAQVETPIHASLSLGSHPPGSIKVVSETNETSTAFMSVP